MLSDFDIHWQITNGNIGYIPYDRVYLNPASVDMTLSGSLRVPSDSRTIDTQQVEPGHTHEAAFSEGYLLYPGKFVLACTNESVHIPDNMVARVEGKSSLGRLGLAVHITAGFIDPGFQGQVTLEIANLSPWSIVLHKNMRIAQIAFSMLSGHAERPYSQTGRYQGSRGPIESRYRIS
jgi:dCTP deaminase